MSKKNIKTSENAKKLEISLSLFIAEHNLPFAVLDHLNILLKQNLSDSEVVKKMVMNRHKGQIIIKEIMAPENSKIISEITNRQYFSLVVE